MASDTLPDPCQRPPTMDRTDLQRLLPHQGDALWLEQVLAHDALHIDGVCDWSAVQRFSAHASGMHLFEAAAQLCAAHGALHAQTGDAPPIRMAMVGKLNQFRVLAEPAGGAAIHLHAEQEAQSPAGALYAFNVRQADRPLAEGKLLLVLVRD